MGTTKSTATGLLAVFEEWIVGDGPIRLRRLFESGEHESGSGLVRYDDDDDALVGVFLPQGREAEPTLYRRTYADWLSRRARPHVDKMLTSFGDEASRCKSSRQVSNLLLEFGLEAQRLRSLGYRLEDSTLRIVVTSWMTRVKEDAEMIAGETESRSRSRGGRPRELNEVAIKEAVSILLQKKTMWHVSGTHAATPNRSQLNLQLQKDDQLSGGLQVRSLDVWIKRALGELADEGRLTKPDGV